MGVSEVHSMLLAPEAQLESNHSSANLAHIGNNKKKRHFLSLDGITITKVIGLEIMWTRLKMEIGTKTMVTRKI